MGRWNWAGPRVAAWHVLPIELQKNWATNRAMNWATSQTINRASGPPYKNWLINPNFTDSFNKSHSVDISSLKTAVSPLTTTIQSMVATLDGKWGIRGRLMCCVVLFPDLWMECESVTNSCAHMYKIRKWHQPPTSYSVAMSSKYRFSSSWRC